MPENPLDPPPADVPGDLRALEPYRRSLEVLSERLRRAWQSAVRFYDLRRERAPHARGATAPRVDQAARAGDVVAECGPVEAAAAAWWQRWADGGPYHGSSEPDWPPLGPAPPGGWLARAVAREAVHPARHGGRRNPPTMGTDVGAHLATGWFDRLCCGLTGHPRAAAALKRAVLMMLYTRARAAGRYGPIGTKLGQTFGHLRRMEQDALERAARERRTDEQ